MRVRIIGIGMGPHQVTPEAADALRDADYVIAAEKRDGDALLAIRREIADAYGVPVVVVPDPARDREPTGDGGYVGAVAGWHAARVAAYEAVLAERPGTAAFLVWGDPAFYDSTIRIVEAIAERGSVEVEYDVVPGISALQLLAARHRIVLHDIGQPLHVTTGRLLADAVSAGQTNIAVMLNRSVELDGLEDWTIWWGGNLGRPEEELVAGRVGDVLEEIAMARERIRGAAGWVLDIFVVRRAAG
ncbi:precorrin-6A synthase (deacetylating) [Nocardioides immobilis]|uniref:Precorrin-6A synthase (Deacetylating) n=1 Tax=Nocardioides immobilis TaxID=2049295 RepID=A0A417XWR2_9ACTN|nr:precorrin-6A synthase (deacetylating) [Nocardioides immobilis]RHW24700.1 precorrin-6A synthase (deacetylating) [Nocardioides immobilis]